MRLFFVVLFLGVGVASGRWVRRGRSNQPTSFVGEATNELATAIFQGYIDDNKNIAFSPLGYSAILAILAEGADGETKEQLVSALHLPPDQNLTRKTYRYIMERLKNKNEYKFNQPELKNYFYVYKNYTVNPDYKKVLEDYYLTDVRSVERYNSDHDIDEVTTEYVLDEKKDDKIDDVPELSPPKETEKFISFAVEDTPEYKPKNIKEKIKQVKTSKDEGNDEETMVAVEARNHRSLRILQDKNDISSSLSVNSVGKKTDTKSISNSLMIIFNGMYFRGSWKKPFDKIETGIFYKSDTEKKQVPMMKTKGHFKTGYLPGLDSEALQIPYDGDRYALLLLVPRSRDGLPRLAADLPSAPLTDTQQALTEEELCVSLPSFYVETTTKPIAALAKFGVSSIFSREAQLPGVSSTEGLFVQELVQHVAVRVDNADSLATNMASANTVTEQTKNLPIGEKAAHRFNVDRPFLFFIVDVLDNLVVVAGKVVDPEQPTPFEL